MQKLYRININHFEDPLKNEGLLDLVGIRRREKVIRYRMPDDRKRSLGAGIIIRKILDENGLTESCLRYSDNEKPVVDGLFLMYLMRGTMLWECCQTAKSGAILRKMPMRLLRWQNIISTIQSLLTSRLRRTKIRRFLRSGH